MRKHGLRALWIGIVLLGLIAGGCTTAQESSAGGVEVRVANRSDRDFDQVDVTFTSKKVSYGPVAKGATSEYRTVQEEAYRYALVVVTAGGEELRFQPIDFVGETPLAPGRYTYALNIDPNDRQVTIDLIED
jgi:hypothetical protein